MDEEKLTGKQPFHQRSLMGKGNYVAGNKQRCKAVAAFYCGAFCALVTKDTIGY